MSLKARILGAIGTFFTIAIFAVLFSYLQIDWTKWRPATCMPSNCFCEKVHLGTIRQPSNTYSNLGFVLAGCLFIAFGPFSRKSSEKNTEQFLSNGDSLKKLSIYSPPYFWLYGLSVVAVGLFSFLYHASMTFAGQWLDVMAMYLIITFAILYAVNRAFPLSPTKFISIFVSLNIALGIFLYYVPTLRRQAFAALVFTALAAEFISRKKLKEAAPSLRWLWLAVGSMATAFAIWLIDYYRIICDPESLIQGHAIWHLLSALSASFLFLYFRTPENSKR